MAGDRFEFGFFRGLEGLTTFPGVFDGRYDPEVTLGVTHDPVLRTSAIHEDSCHAAGCGNHLPFPLGSRRVTSDPEPWEIVEAKVPASQETLRDGDCTECDERNG